MRIENAQIIWLSSCNSFAHVQEYIYMHVARMSCTNADGLGVLMRRPRGGSSLAWFFAAAVAAAS